MRHRTAVVAAVLMMVVAACGDDAGTDTETDPTTAATTGDTTAAAGSQSGGAGGSGFVTLGDETIDFDSARCFLQPQDAAAGGGQILATGQGFGVNAAGDDVSLDFTRWNEDSQFTGDDIKVFVGDPFSDSGVEFSAILDLGAVDMAGSTLSADGFTFQNWTDFSQPELPGAFEHNC